MDHINREKRLIQAAAFCSLMGAITTLFLLFGPRPGAEQFSDQVLLFEDPRYLTRLWVLFLHPQFNFLSMLGVGYLLFRKYPLAVTFGTFFLLLWAFSELSQQALLLDALNQIWRPAYQVANTETEKQLFETLIRAAEGISDSKYFLVIYGFGLGSLFFSAAFLRETGWPRLIGVALLFIGLLSLASFARYYLGINAWNDWVNHGYEWVYSWLQPLVRMATGYWLLRQFTVYRDPASAQ